VFRRMIYCGQLAHQSWHFLHEGLDPFRVNVSGPAQAVLALLDGRLSFFVLRAAVERTEGILSCFASCFDVCQQPEALPDDDDAHAADKTCEEDEDFLHAAEVLVDSR